MVKKILIAVCLCGMILPVFAKYKVAPRKRYRFEFEARATGKIFPEEFRCQGVKLDYPGVRMEFTDNKNRKMVRLARGCFFHVHSREFVPGAIEFYAGEGIRYVKLVTKDAEVRNVKLVPVEAGSNIAIPLDHRVSGQIRDYFITPGEGGEAVFDVCKGKIYGDPIPVEGGRRYRLTVYGYTGVSRALRAGLEFYTHDRGGRNSTVRGSRTQIQIKGKNQQVIYNFKTPANTRWLRVTMMWGFVRSYKVEEIQ